jgi:hypothetical protein
MPTVIIPTTAGHFMTDLFAMKGNGFQDKRTDNLCGWRGFICGIQPTVSAAYSQCLTGTTFPSGPDTPPPVHGRRPARTSISRPRAFLATTPFASRDGGGA